jgi:ribosomal protein S18 acetylase RimI-like enzyme
MPTDLAFRDFHARDLPALEAMILALYEEDVSGAPMTHDKIRRTVGELTCHPDKGRILVFSAGEAVVGYALLVCFWSNEHGGDLLCIDELYVKPAWRRQGIAAAFFEHLAAGGCGAAAGLRLEVAPANEQALDVYRRLGFTRAPNTVLVKPVP